MDLNELRKLIFHDNTSLKMRRRSHLDKASSSSKNEHDLTVKYGFHGPAELLERRKRQDFFIKPRYENTLPDIPCDPKHILMPLNPNRFELSPPEQLSFYEQLADLNCGVSLDLVASTLNWKPGKKAPSANLELDPKDHLLLEDDNSKETEDMVKRSKTHKTNVTWLRRPEYISSEPAEFKTQNGEKAEYRMERAIGKKIKRESKWEELAFLNNHKLRVKTIENSFEIASQPILEHPSKPGVYAVDVVPVFPDFDLQDHKFVEIVFDTSPSVSGHLGKIEEFQMNNALLQPIVFNEEEKDMERIGYFVPSLSGSVDDHSSDNEAEASETCEAREFLMARDYIFKQALRNLSTIQDTYVFMEKEGKLTYSDMSKKINLNRSIKIDSQSFLRRVKLMVKYQSPNQDPQSDSESLDCSSTVVSGVSGFSAIESTVTTVPSNVVSDYQD